jgi:signal transduction histidine kinase
MFINVITHAVSFSSPDRPVPTRMWHNDFLVEVAVVDDGAGIASEEILYLFGRFFRVRETHTIEGIGLGWYIVKMLVEAHGGCIRVESGVGKGSSLFHLAGIVAAC